MATTKTTSTETPTRPLIQIDDLVREMTEEEFASYEESIASAPAPQGPVE
jgi:hypothetical protein